MRTITNSRGLLPVSRLEMRVALLAAAVMAVAEAFAPVCPAPVHAVLHPILSSRSIAPVPRVDCTRILRMGAGCCRREAPIQQPWAHGGESSVWR